MNTPVLVRSPKLSIVGPGQYRLGTPGVVGFSIFFYPFFMYPIFCVPFLGVFSQLLSIEYCASTKSNIRQKSIYQDTTPSAFIKKYTKYGVHKKGIKENAMAVMAFHMLVYLVCHRAIIH